VEKVLSRCDRSPPCSPFDELRLNSIYVLVKDRVLTFTRNLLLIEIALERTSARLPRVKSSCRLPVVASTCLRCQ
jgi:hypothetical protein